MTSSLGPLGRLLLVVSVSSATLAVATTARAQAKAGDKVDKKECIAAYEDGQRLRKESKLADARTKLLVCAQDGCPSSLRRDCTTWVSEIEQSTPTLVLEAVGDGGHDLFDVRVSLDGKPLGERLDGKAVSVDPGAHVVRFERAGAASIEERVLAREGEKNRRVVARFGAAGTAGTSSSSTAGSPPAGLAYSPPPYRGPSTPASVYIFGGVGIFGLAAFGYMGALGLSAKSDLDKAGCKPSCPSSDVQKAKVRFIGADIGLGVGLVSLGIATVIYLTRDSASDAPPETAWRLDVAPTAGGAGGSFVTSF